MSELIEDQNCIKTIMEITEITEMDSTGFGIMVSLLNTIRKKGGDLRLAGRFVPEVNEAFELCGLSRVFKRYPDVETAIRSFDD